jgi:hypothetical protein
MAGTSIGVQELAQAVSEGVLRAVAANSQFKGFFGKDGPGLIVNPIITAGGIYYFGRAAQFITPRAGEIGAIERPG